MRNQTLVRVGARVGDGVQGAGVLDDAADVVQREFRQAGVAVACEQVLAILPDGLVHVHAGTVVANDGLGHERGGLAVGVGHVVHDVLDDLRPVGALDQRAELGADFQLAGAGHFMVVHFNRHAHLFHQQAHFRTHVLERINRGNGEVAALDCGTMARVAAFEFQAGRPRGFFGLDLDERARHVGVPGHAVEHEEFGFRTEVGGVAQAGGLQVGFGALGQRTRVAVIALQVRGFHDVARQDQGRLFAERIQVGGRAVGDEQHVGRFDALPTRDRRTVESLPAFQLVFIDRGGGHGNVVLTANRIGKAEIHEFDFVIGDLFQDVFRACHVISIR
ncbi:hypothetical protein D3C72_1158620 [compost metagenome]